MSTIRAALFYKTHPDAVVPKAATGGSVGYDLATVENEEIQPGEVKILRTGLVTKPPHGYHWEIFPRSSLPRKFGLVIPNSLGLIDSDYTSPSDELGIQVLNFTKEKVVVKKGSRIAQLVLRETVKPKIVEAKQHWGSKTRGGFGSTGVE